MEYSVIRYAPAGKTSRLGPPATQAGAESVPWVVTTAICPSLAGPMANPGRDEGEAKGRWRASRTLTFILSLVGNVHSYPSVP